MTSPKPSDNARSLSHRRGGKLARSVVCRVRQQRREGLQLGTLRLPTTGTLTNMRWDHGPLLAAVNIFLLLVQGISQVTPYGGDRNSHHSNLGRENLPMVILRSRIIPAIQAHARLREDLLYKLLPYEAVENTNTAERQLYERYRQSRESSTPGTHRADHKIRRRKKSHRHQHHHHHHHSNGGNNRYNVKRL